MLPSPFRANRNKVATSSSLFVGVTLDFRQLKTAIKSDQLHPVRGSDS